MSNKNNKFDGLPFSVLGSLDKQQAKELAMWKVITGKDNLTECDICNDLIDLDEVEYQSPLDPDKYICLTCYMEQL